MRCSRSSRFSCNVRPCASSPLWEEAASSASLSPQPSLLCSRLNATACSACWRFDLRAVTMASLVSALARQWCAARLSLFTCSASSRFCIFIVSISKSFSWKRRKIPFSIAATNSLECRCLFSSRSCRTCSPWMCWEQLYQQQPRTKFKWKNSMETLHHLFRSHPASLSLSWLKQTVRLKMQHLPGLWKAVQSLHSPGEFVYSDPRPWWTKEVKNHFLLFHLLKLRMSSSVCHPQMQVLTQWRHL